MSSPFFSTKLNFNRKHDEHVLCPHFRKQKTQQKFSAQVKKHDEHVLCPHFRKQKTQQKFSAQVISLYNKHMELINNSLHMLKSFRTSDFFI